VSPKERFGELLQSVARVHEDRDDLKDIFSDLLETRRICADVFFGSGTMRLQNSLPVIRREGGIGTIRVQNGDQSRERDAVEVGQFLKNQRIRTTHKPLFPSP
jgi:hypothetical protein